MEVIQDVSLDQIIIIIKITVVSYMGKISLTPHNYSLVQEAIPFNTLNMSLPGHQQVTKHLQLPERTQKYPRLKHTNQWTKFSVV